MQVREIMTENPACCTPDTSLREVAKMMAENDCGCIPVVENQSNKKPVGTVTDRDITIRAFTTGENPTEMKAADVMTKGVATVSPETSIESCADVMEEKKIRRVLVVDRNGGCCGIIAQADIAEHVENPHLVNYIVEEISEAAPSPNQGVFNRMQQNKSSANNQSRSMKSRSMKRFAGTRESSRQHESTMQKSGSLFSVSNLFPLLAGVGAGAAINYFYGNRQPQTISHKYRKSYAKNDQMNCAVPAKTDVSTTDVSTMKNTEMNRREVIPSKETGGLETNRNMNTNLGRS